MEAVGVDQDLTTLLQKVTAERDTLLQQNEQLWGIIAKQRSIINQQLQVMTGNGVGNRDGARKPVGVLVQQLDEAIDRVEFKVTPVPDFVIKRPVVSSANAAGPSSSPPALPVKGTLVRPPTLSSVAANASRPAFLDSIDVNSKPLPPKGPSSAPMPSLEQTKPVYPTEEDPHNVPRDTSSQGGSGGAEQAVLANGDGSELPKPLDQPRIAGRPEMRSYEIRKTVSHEPRHQASSLPPTPSERSDKRGKLGIGRPGYEAAGQHPARPSGEQDNLPSRPATSVDQRDGSSHENARPSLSKASVPTTLVSDAIAQMDDKDTSPTHAKFIESIAQTFEDGRKQDFVPPEPSVNGTGQPAEEAEKKIKPPLATLTGIDVRVTGSSVKANQQGKEIIYFTLQVRRQREAQTAYPTSPPLAPSRKSTTFGLLRFSKRDGKVEESTPPLPPVYTDLWRVEKLYSDFLTLDTKLKRQKARLMKHAKLPDKNLFSTHTPSKADQRRYALEQYIQHAMSLPFEDQNDICQFLSTGIISDSATIEQRKGCKEGYLTKRGKNFGGWKRRYFVLNGLFLEYFEHKDGPRLGRIFLEGAQIMQQKPLSETADQSTPYRHAFRILERHDGAPMRQFIFCADSDAERDEWVDALYFRNGLSNDPQSSPTSGPVSEFQQPNAARPTRHTKLRQPKSSQELRTTRRQSNWFAQAIGRTSADTNAPPPQLSSVSKSPPFVPASGKRQQSSPHLSDNETQEAPRERVERPSPLEHVSEELVKPPSSPLAREFPNSDNDQAAQAKSSKLNASARDKKLARMTMNWGRRIFSQPEKKTGSSQPVFGAPLDIAVQVARANENYWLPAVMYRCIEYLEAKGAVEEEGIYRLSGSSATIKLLQTRFDAEGDVDLLRSDTAYDIHAVAGLLKTFLRELPTSVLTPNLHEDFVRVIDLRDRRERVRELGRLVSALPVVNYTLLRALVGHLIRIIEKADVNKMTLRNVGIVFSPTLGIPAGVFNLLIIEFEYIFWVNENGVPAPKRISDLEPKLDAAKQEQQAGRNAEARFSGSSSVPIIASPMDDDDDDDEEAVVDEKAKQSSLSSTLHHLTNAGNRQPSPQQDADSPKNDANSRQRKLMNRATMMFRREDNGRTNRNSVLYTGGAQETFMNRERDLRPVNPDTEDEGDVEDLLISQDYDEVSSLRHKPSSDDVQG